MRRNFMAPHNVSRRMRRRLFLLILAVFALASYRAERNDAERDKKVRDGKPEHLVDVGTIGGQISRNSSPWLAGNVSMSGI